MTDSPQEILCRRVNLLGSMIAIGWLVFSLALAVTAILLYGKARLNESQTQARLDELSGRLTDLSKQLAGGPRLAGSAPTQPDGIPVATSGPPGPAVARGPAANPLGPAVVEGPSRNGSTPRPSPAGGAGTSGSPGNVSGATGRQPATAPQPDTETVATAGAAAAAGTTQPNDGGYHVSPVDGLLGPDANRPAGLAGWFYDLKTSASPDDQNPMFMVISGPRTIDAALAELAKADPADAARQKIPAEDQLNAAQLFLQRGSDAQAYQWATAVVGIAPKIGRAWLIGGLAAARQKNWPDAITKLTQAADLLPGRPEPLKALGEVQFAAGKSDLAIAAYRKAVAAVPADLGVALRLADLLVRAKQFDEAAKLLRQVVDADPRLSVARAGLAKLLVERDRAKEAVELLDATPPNAAPEIRLALARGRALIALNDLPAAEAALEKAVDQTPLSAEGWYLLGLARVKQRKNAPAAVALERSIAIESTSAEAWQYLSVALANDGRLDDAIAKLQEAIRLNVSSAEMHYMLAVLCVTKKQPDAAFGSLKQAVKLDPTYLARARSEPIFTNLPADSAIAKFLKEEK